MQRTMGGEAEQYRPIEDVLTRTAIPAIVGWESTGPGAARERELFALPPRKGGLGICDLTATAKPNHDLSREATAACAGAVPPAGRRHVGP